MLQLLQLWSQLKQRWINDTVRHFLCFNIRVVYGFKYFVLNVVYNHMSSILGVARHSAGETESLRDSVHATRTPLHA